MGVYPRPCGGNKSPPIEGLSPPVRGETPCDWVVIGLYPRPCGGNIGWIVGLLIVVLGSIPARAGETTLGKQLHLLESPPVRGKLW